MTFVYIFWRYGMQSKRLHNTLEEAIEDAAGDTDSGEGAYDHIENEQGEIILERKLLGAKIWELLEAQDKETR